LFANISPQTKVPSDYIFIKPKLVPIKKPIAQPSQATTSCLSFLLKPLPFNALQSNNWCGFVASTSIFNPQPKTVTFVEGTWVIPTIAQVQNNRFYSIWVGIDGFNTGTIEQIGTAYQRVNGRSINYAWFEMFPQASMLIENFPVRPGNSITASVEFRGRGQYKLTMLNNTTKRFTVIPLSQTRTFNSPRTAVEWIVEAPSRQGVLPLAHFNTVHFTRCKATIKGVTGDINNKRWQHAKLNMVSPNGVVKAVASNLKNKGKAFNVNWRHS